MEKEQSVCMHVWMTCGGNPHIASLCVAYIYIYIYILPKLVHPFVLLGVVGWGLGVGMLVAPRNTKVVASILACLSLNICVCVFGGGGGLGGLVPESGPKFFSKDTKFWANTSLQNRPNLLRNLHVYIYIYIYIYIFLFYKSFIQETSPYP